MTDHPKKAAPVGYGRPPLEHRFKKGQSGNPKGRPRKKEPPQVEVVIPGLHQTILREAHRVVTAREGDQTLDLTVIEAVARALGVNAMKGNQKAQLAFAEMVEAAETKVLAERGDILAQTLEYKTGWQREFEAYDRAGQPRPQPLPHPDDVFIDPRTGEVTVVGPLDERENAGWHRAAEQRRTSIEEIEELKQLIKQDPENKEFYEDDIAFERRLVDMLDLFLPSEEMRRAVDFNPRERERRMAEFVRHWQRRKRRRRVSDRRGR